MNYQFWSCFNFCLQIWAVQAEDSSAIRRNENCMKRVACLRGKKKKSPPTHSTAFPASPSTLPLQCCMKYPGIEPFRGWSLSESRQSLPWKTQTASALHPCCVSCTRHKVSTELDTPPSPPCPSVKSSEKYCFGRCTCIMNVIDLFSVWYFWCFMPLRTKLLSFPACWRFHSESKMLMNGCFVASYSCTLVFCSGVSKYVLGPSGLLSLQDLGCLSLGCASCDGHAARHTDWLVLKGTSLCKMSRSSKESAFSKCSLSSTQKRLNRNLKSKIPF